MRVVIFWLGYWVTLFAVLVSSMAVGIGAFTRSWLLAIPWVVALAIGGFAVRKMIPRGGPSFVSPLVLSTMITFGLLSGAAVAMSLRLTH